MRRASEIINDYIGLEPSRVNLDRLNSELLIRQREYALLHCDHNHPRAMIPNVSTARVVGDNGLIKALGISHPRDLLVDNFGYLIKELFTPATQTDTYVDITGASKTCRLKTSNAAMFYGPVSVSCALGDGLTPVARSDYYVESAIGVSGVVSTPGYASGVVTIYATLGPFVTAETVAESAIYVNAYDIVPSGVNLTMMRFNYTETPVGIGESVVIETTIGIA